MSPKGCGPCPTCNGPTTVITNGRLPFWQCEADRAHTGWGPPPHKCPSCQSDVEELCLVVPELCLCDAHHHVSPLTNVSITPPTKEELEATSSF
jgi:hypothetical protein